MRKSLIDILWEELKQSFWYANCKDISDEKKIFDMWSEYQIKIIHRIGEEQK